MGWGLSRLLGWMWRSWRVRRWLGGWRGRRGGVWGWWVGGLGGGGRGGWGWVGDGGGGGGVVWGVHVGRLLEGWPDARVRVCYGPTEATVFASSALVEEPPGEDGVPLGRALPGA